MENIADILDQLIDTIQIWGIVIIAVTVIAFIVQLYYLLFVCARIPSFRNAKPEKEAKDAGISVIVVLHNADYDYLEDKLPVIMAQDHPQYELVLVDLSGDEEFSEAIALISEHNPKITTTTLPNDPRFAISNKMALNVGIKAAKYEDVLFTTTDCRPASDKWLSLMSRGFDTGDVVIGYCALENKRGIANKFMRIGQLAVSARWLSAAMRRKTYAGTLCNMGFTKSIYFANGGFNYLNINLGEDSLFISKIATRNNVSVIASPNSVVIRRFWGGLGLWNAERKFSSYVFRYYKGWVKRYVSTELWSRIIFFAGIAAIIALLPREFAIFGGALLLVRFLILLFEFRRIGKRLGEKRLMWILPVHDIISPVYEAVIMASRRIKPSRGIWRR